MSRTLLCLLIAACNLDSTLPAADASDPDSALPAWTQTAFVKASNTGSGDVFGGGDTAFGSNPPPLSIALSGDGSTLVVGAIDEDSDGTLESNNDADGAGAAYVFVRNGASWSKQAYLKASNVEAGDQFGQAIAISANGDTVIIGAPNEKGGDAADPSNNSATRSGAGYVFVRNGTTWEQQAYLKAAPIGSDDRFGSLVAMSASGDIVAIAAPREDSASTDPADNSTTDAGAVYIFERSGGTWTQRAFIKAPNAGMSDVFGRSVSLSSAGGTLAVGAVFEDSAARGVDGDSNNDDAMDAGAVYVFDSAGITNWSLIGYLKASNSKPGDLFGEALSLSGDGATLAVGAGSEDSSSTSADDGLAPDSGAIYVFKRSANTWIQDAYLKAPNVGPDDRFGQGVALSADGGRLVGSASGEDGSPAGGPSDNSLTDSGAVYVFERSNSNWLLEAYLKALNADPSDGFGKFAVTAGNTIVANAVGEDSAATLVGGDGNDDTAMDSGAVYVFEQ